MKYQIDDFVLDTQMRTLSNQENIQNIRPKTLALLLYIANKTGQIISKQELLDNVWDDVNVDEGVVFQSVREIRKLFANASIIQNYPRKGYEFTAQISELNQKKHATSSINQSLKYALLIGTIVLLSVLSVMFFQKEDTDSQYEQTIAVLPIKNYVPYAENDWVYLGGMEQLIAKLKGLPRSVLVYQGTYIPRLMHLADLERDYDSNKISNLFNVSGATVIVETEIHGNVYDYKLVYKFHVANDVKQGVILDTSINGALSVLSEKVAAFLHHPLQRTKDVPMKEFSDALFAEAMISYESNWQTSISFFESYVALNPDSVTALVYLSKLYLWSGEIAQADRLMDNALKYTKGEPQEAAHIYLIKGRVAAKQKQWQPAMRFYEQASQKLEQHVDWFLKASIAEEQGLAYLEQDLITESFKAFNTALSFYQIIRSPIGINSSKLHLATVLLQQGKVAEAEKYYLQAKQRIEGAELKFLYTRLNDHEKRLMNNK